MFEDEEKSPNVKWEESHVSREDRTELLGNENKVFWFTGLSGSGKSTLGRALEKKLHDDGVLTFMLDGDNVRHGLNKDLGFSPEDRDENIRRIGEVAKLMYESGVTVIACFISPYRDVREKVRGLIGEDFVEVFVDCPLEVCEERDSKGLYEKAREGEIDNFTGINAPYEEPEDAEVVVDTEELDVEECVEKIMEYL